MNFPTNEAIDCVAKQLTLIRQPPIQKRKAKLGAIEKGANNSHSDESVDDASQTKTNTKTRQVTVVVFGLEKSKHLDHSTFYHWATPNQWK